MSLVSPNRGYPLEKIDGDPGAMGDWSRSILDVVSELEELRTEAYSVGDIAGSGSAIVAVRADGRTLGGAITPDIALGEQIVRVLQNYADAFRSSAERANALIDDIEAAHSTWSSKAGEAESAGLEALWSSRSDDDDAAEANEAAHDAVAARDSAREALDALWVEYEGYYSLWDEAYDAALAALAVDSSAALTIQARDFLADLLAAATPEEVLRLWLENPALHQELMESHPEIIGNLDGIPYGTRADANYAVLEDLYENREDLPEPRRSEIEALWNEIIEDPETNHLISFDPNGSEQVTAAIWYGSLDAGSVSVLVPGMNSDVRSIGEWGASALALMDGAGPDAASIVWFGYDSPNEPEEPFMDRAEDGAAALIGFLNGLDLLAPTAQISVIAHSYGSTTAALAIGSDPDGLGVDQLIVLGSAGFPSDPEVLANLGTGPEIFATLSEGDMWARIGRDTSWGGGHSTSPETLDGVTEFGSDGGESADGEHLHGTPGHSTHDGGNSVWGWWEQDNGYLEPGTESFYNIQEILVTGEPGTEIDGPGSGNGFWDFPDWLPFDPYRF